MPQMAPLNWLSLFLMIIMIMMMISVCSYFSFMTQSKKISLTEKKVNNWKW